MVTDVKARTTLGDLETAIDSYEAARVLRESAEADLKAARQRIIDAFSEGGMRVYNDSKGRTTTVDTRYQKRINYKEAEAMLEADVMRKLTRESTSIVVNVKYPKKETEE